MTAKSLDFSIIEGLPETEEEPLVEGLPSPYFSVSQGAQVVEPLCDEYYSTEAFIWCQLYQTQGDLEIEQIGEEFEGEVPWWDETVQEIGLDYLLGVTWGLGFPPVLDWALREGLSPGQPFLVYVQKPVWFQDYYGECDVEIDAWIVRKLPAEISVRDFEKVVDEIYQDRKSQEEQKEDLGKAQLADTKRLFLRRNWYGRYGEVLSVELHTSRVNLDPQYQGSVRLCSGRSETGNPKEGFRSPSRTSSKRKSRAGLNCFAARVGW